MKKILKLLKNSIISIIIILVLIIAQVILDLKLPEYTSKIVNVGIQQNGIEDSVPNVMREVTYNVALKFVDEKDRELFTNSYRILDKDGTEYINYMKKAKEQNDGNIYVLNDINKEERKELSDILTSPLLINYFFTSNEEMIVKIRQQLMIEMQNQSGSSETFDFITMDEQQIIGLKKKFTDKMNEYEPELLKQMSPQIVTYEYNQIGYDLQPLQTKYILNTGLMMILIAFIVMIINVVITYLSARMGAKFSRDLRNEVTEKVMSFSNKEFEEFSTASLITRSTNDIQQIQMLIVMGLRMILYAPILGIGAFTKVNTSPMAWVIGVALLTILVLVITLLIIALPKFNRLQKLIDKLNLVSREIITGIPVIRAFATEKKEEERFDKANTDLAKTNLFVNRVMSIMMPTMFLIMNCVSILIIWVGANYIDAGTLQIGTMMAFINYTMQIIMAFLMLTMLSVMMPRAIVSIKRIGEIFNKKNSVKESKNPTSFNNNNGEIEFKDVYFRYPNADEDVLQNISFHIKPGTTTAFIGSTGSGKSTVINLIPRFFDVTGGKILLDGVDIRDMSFKDLRGRLGFVPQKGVLFTGTIKSNISFGADNLTEEQMKKAAEIAQAFEFIDKLEKKFDSPISQGGTNVSGGQKQRLAIARAIAKNPEILIFDDSFSALDFKTDVNLRKAIKANLKNKTVLIVASRIATIMDADQIIVLEEGKIVGIGTHKELLKDNEVYKEIATSQLSEEELKNER